MFTYKFVYVNVCKCWDTCVCIKQIKSIYHLSCHHQRASSIANSSIHSTKRAAITNILKSLVWQPPPGIGPEKFRNRCGCSTSTPPWQRIAGDCTRAIPHPRWMIYLYATVAQNSRGSYPSNPAPKGGCSTSTPSRQRLRCNFVCVFVPYASRVCTCKWLAE